MHRFSELLILILLYASAGSSTLDPSSGTGMQRSHEGTPSRPLDWNAAHTGAARRLHGGAWAAQEPAQALPAVGDVRVTVVILNWLRPENVLKIVRTYVEYNSVAEVIVWMCKEETRFSLSHPKLRIIDDVSTNARYGLSTRFKACLMARTPWVLIQDDDHYLREPGLLKLISHKLAHPRRIVGTFGRDWPQDQEPEYIRRPVLPGPARIVLTILLLTDQDTCRAFWEHAPLVQEFVERNSKPLWNGEDIFLSLVSFKLTGQPPLVVGQVPKAFMSQRGTGIHFLAKDVASSPTSADGVGAAARTSGFSGHDDYRDRFLKYAVKALHLDYGNQQYGRHVRSKAGSGRRGGGRHVPGVGRKRARRRQEEGGEGDAQHHQGQRQRRKMESSTVF